MPPPNEIGIRLQIERAGGSAFDGGTSVARMARKFEELIRWLGIDNVFPNGVILLTGTGIVPPDEFALQAGDVVRITIDGVGTLVNSVTRAAPASR
jgi:2-dehydro-3-deoxy-D-arabinonate dehydratase